MTTIPRKFGTYTFIVTLPDPNGVPIQGASATADMTMPGMARSLLNVTLAPTSPPVRGSYQVQGAPSMRGAWHAVVQVALPNHGQILQAAFDFTTAC